MATLLKNHTHVYEIEPPLASKEELFRKSAVLQDPYKHSSPSRPASALLIVIVCTTVTKYITNQLFNLYKFKKHTLPRSDSYISLLYATGLTVLNKSLCLQLKNRSYIQSRGYCLI